MDKAEYVFRLNAGLMNCPETFRNDVLESFEEHVQKEREKGKSTAAILKELGDPEGILKDIQELYGGNPGRPEIDSLWISKNRKLMLDITDYRMGAAILIPLLFVILIFLHQAGVI